MRNQIYTFSNSTTYIGNIFYNKPYIFKICKEDWCLPGNDDTYLWMSTEVLEDSDYCILRGEVKLL
jgi:hypothetical protein